MSITLKNDRLQVTIAEPGVFPATTYRFDRAGFITQVTLDGKHDFCTMEPTNLSHPTSGGVGICNEIQFNQAAEGLAIGERFPKPGVGNLRKDSADGYIFHHIYDSQDYPVSWEADETSVTFRTQAIPCQGYAIEQVKTIRLDENRLIMEMQMTNVGSKEIHAKEYCHNFVTLDHQPIGPDYFLQFPAESLEDKLQMKHGNGWTGCRGGVSIREYANTDSLAEIPADCFIPASDGSFTWKLTNRNTDTAISETISEMPVLVAIWTIDHLVCPEIKVAIDLAPGQSKTWSRTWNFN